MLKTNELSNQYVPVVALIAYKNRQHNFYLETRTIDDEGNLLEATPVSKKFIQDLVKQFTPKDKKDSTNQYPHGIIPNNLLLANTAPGNETLVWWDPPQKKMMYFKKSTGMENGEYYVPGTVYVVKNSSLKVFVFSGKKPTKKTRLLSAPYYNTTPESGSVCLGNAKTEVPTDRTWQNIIDYWEKLFWCSENSHTMSTSPTKNGYILTNEIKASAQKPFNTNCLKKSIYTLEQLINKEK